MEVSQEYANIAHRLEQLNQWQEEQKRILFERQDSQRKLLGLEHKKMYEMLGIFHQNTDMFKENIMTDYIDECENALGDSTSEQTVKKGIQQETVQTDGKIIKRPFLKRKQGLITRFKVDPDDFRLDKLPPYKFQSKHPSLHFQKVRTKKVFRGNPVHAPQPETSVPKLTPSKKDESAKSSCLSIDKLEQKFQKSLMFSKTACNSTPDMKSQSSIKDSPEAISWATILDPQNIKPIENPQFSATSQESQCKSDETSIFELLEQKAKDGSFNLNSSFIRKFLNKNAPDDDDSLLLSYDQTIRPTPCEISQNATLKDSESSGESTDLEPNEPKSKQNHHVRFVEMPSANASTQNLSQTIEASDVSQAFEEFKKRIFENQSGTGSTDVSQCDAFVEDILQKAELIKKRLGELELEIATFKQNNLELIKSKREHELEKAHFEQEQKESRDKLNDERIQMEIYLHDERMKLEDERKDWEKKVRLQKSAVTAKERREATKLREQVAALENELKKKEELHITSQSRLRSRIKNLEGSMRQLNLNISELQKENKRLEAECLQANRQHSDKMLREINRNIAKLAPRESWVLSSSSPPPATASAQPMPSQQPAKKQSTPAHTQSRTSPPKRKSNLKTKPKPILRPITPTSSPEEEEEDDEETSGTSSPEREFEKPKAVTFSKSPESKKILAKNQENTPLSAPSDNSFKREIVNADGSKDIWYPNGNLKKISADGMTIRMLYFNRDIKETNINEGTVKYYYAEINTWHTTYVDGLEILEFPNGQTEHRYKNGKVEVHFPNNSIKLTDPSDEHKLEEWRFADGSNLIQMKNGDKILLLSNGQKEVHTSLSKRREYPDGTVKLVYPDGSQETRYSNGRIRLKDKDGKLIMDTQTVC